ncbi:MAG: hypothetical protein ACK4UZ_06615, partial [Rhizobium rhizophilum]
DQQPLQDRWNRVQKHKGFFIGTIRFALWTMTETLRAFSYALRMVRETTEVSHPDAPMVIHAPGLRLDTPAAVSAKQRGTAYA